jgi:hypothetical protein
MGLNVGFGLVPGPDKRQWVALQVTDGQIIVTLPGIDPNEIDEFADRLAEGLKMAGTEARRANSGLLIPGFNIDPVVVEELKRKAANAHPPAGVEPVNPPPGHPG